MSVPSPCISLCRMSPDTGLCEGCQRTLDEIAGWSGATDVGKRAILAAVARRREQLGVAPPNPRAGAST